MQTVSTKCRQRRMRALKHLNRARPAWVAALSAATSALADASKFPDLAGPASRLERDREDLDLVSALAEANQAQGDVAGTIATCEDALAQSSLVSGLAGNLAGLAHDAAKAEAAA